MTLHHERIERGDRTPDHWLLILHGIFGAGRNWATVARRLVAERPEWGAVLVDLREHGRSRGFEPPHTLASAAADLNALAEAGPAPTAVLGHSFGGKVALAYARDHGAGLEQLWLVESTPSPGEPRGEAWSMLQTLRSLPERFDSRLGAIAAMERQGVRTPVAQWMATNLEPAPEGGYLWRIDLTAMEDLLLDFFRTDLWSVVESPPAGLTIHVVRATGSSVLAGASLDRVREAARTTGRVVLHELEGGHWIHADDPEGVVRLLARNL